MEKTMNNRDEPGGFLIPEQYVMPLRKLLREIEEQEAMTLKECEEQFKKEIADNGGKIRIPYLGDPPNIPVFLTSKGESDG